jgi:hypothetical protein
VNMKNKEISAKKEELGGMTQKFSMTNKEFL